MSLLLARDASSARFGSNKSHQCKKLPGSPSLDDLTLMEANPSSSFRPPERVDFCYGAAFTGVSVCTQGAGPGNHRCNVAAFAEGNHVGDRHAIQHIRHRVADFGHRDANSAGLHASAVAAWLISRATGAPNRRQRPIDCTNDLADFNVARGPCQHVTAARPFFCVHDAGLAKFTENGVEKLLECCQPWRSLWPGLFRLQRGKVGQRLETVLTFCGQHRRELSR